LKFPENVFKFKRCTIEDIDFICNLQETTFSHLEDKSILRYNSRKMLAACISDPHFTMGVFHEEKLIAFAMLFDGKNSDENIGKDLEIPDEKLKFVINFKLVIVSPEYRGNGLQLKLIDKLEKIAKDKGKKLICTTTSPFNTHSSDNFLKAGFVFHSSVVKYNGLDRNIYYKKLDDSFDI
jgi:GNAT superfamily N-acetyltransferase